MLALTSYTFIIVQISNTFHNTLDFHFFFLKERQLKNQNSDFFSPEFITRFNLELQQQFVQRANQAFESSRQTEVRLYLFGPFCRTRWRPQVRTRGLTRAASETETAFLRTQADSEKTRRCNVFKLTACEVKTQRRNKDVKYAIKKFRVAAAQRSQPVILSPVPLQLPVPESSACSGS